MLDHGECSKAVHFQFVNPFRIIETAGSGVAMALAGFEDARYVQNSRMHGRDSSSEQPDPSEK